MSILYEDVIRCTIPDEHFDVVNFHALKRAEQMENDEANKYSKVRKDMKTRLELFPTDAYVQMMGEYIINVYVRGPVLGFEAFDTFRKRMNANPKSDDGGSDVPGYQIDAKSSLMRGSQDPIDYTLPVPPGDKYDPLVKHKGKPETVFVLGLVKEADLVVVERKLIIHLMGWAWDHEVYIMMADGVFKNKYVMDAPCLHPMTEFPYETYYKGATRNEQSKNQ